MLRNPVRPAKHVDSSRMRMDSPHLFRCLLVGLILSASAALEAEAQFRFGFPRTQQRQFQSDLRHSYRPRVKVVRPSNSRTLQSGQTLKYEYYARRGGVARIEVRSGYRVVKTINTGGRRSGSGTIVLDASTLRKVSGRNTFRLWAWQAQPGRQSLHGESMGYTLND